MDTAINGSSEGVNILPGLSKLVGQELILVLWVIKAVAIHLRSSLSAIHLKGGSNEV